MGAWKWDAEREAWRKELWIGGQRTKLTFKGSKKEAEEYEARKRIELGVTGVVHEKDAPSFSSFCVDQYTPYAKAHLRGTTMTVRPYQIANLVEFFGTTRLTKLTTPRVEAYKLWRVRDVSKETVNGELNVLSAILTYARETLKLPCATPKINRFKVRKRKGNVKAYTREEVGFILAACALVAVAFLPMVRFLFETGCRKSEAINLLWTRVDFVRGLVRIWNETDDDDDDEAGESANDDRDAYEVKSVEREVTLPDGLLAMLKAQKLKVGASPWVFPVATDRMYTKGQKYKFFPKHTWARVLAKANELAKKADPNARKIAGGPHRCRHTFASHFLQVKPDLFALGRILGHSHTRVTELYAHLLPNHLEGTRNVVTFEPARRRRRENPTQTPPRRPARSRRGA